MNINKNICFFIRALDKPGGAERVTVILSNYLANLGFNVYILTLTNENSFFILDPKIKLACLKATSDKKLLFLYPLYILRLNKYVNRNNIHVFINVCVIMSFVSWFLKFRKHMKIYSWEHFNLDVNPRPLISSLSRKLALYSSLRIIVLSPNDEARYNQKYKKPLKVLYIPNPITIHSDKKSDYEQKNIVTVGRLTSQKGYDMLLQAWSMFKLDTNSEWTLTIVGDGPDRDALNRQAQSLKIIDSIIFIRSTDKIAELYKKASIYVLSSRFEGMPLVLLEAMYMKLPLIAFNCPHGPKELIETGINGILVDNANTRLLADAMIRLVSNKDQRRIMGENSLLRSQQFMINKIALKWIALFNENTNF